MVSCDLVEKELVRLDIAREHLGRMVATLGRPEASQEAQGRRRALIPQTSNWSGTIFGPFLQQIGSSIRPSGYFLRYFH